jgi:starch phosphorylase
MSDITTELDPVLWKQEIERHLRARFAKPVDKLTPYELFRTAAEALRERIACGLMSTADRFRRAHVKSVYYLSMEFLVGRSLRNNLENLGLYSVMKEAFSLLGISLCDILEVEPDAALGNGGLGRLAACFLDSLASLDMPGYGYGIHYEYGLFRQEIDNGYQKEKPDFWASENSPWLIERLDHSYLVPLYGNIEHGLDRNGNYNPMWLNWQVIVGVPHDLPIVGDGGRTINTLRLFSARASDEFDIQIFNTGDYLRAVELKIRSESVSKVLYPSDAVAEGRELRLVQEYFLVACSLRDIFRRFLSQNADIARLSEKVAIQLNDTHPALTIAEMMRLLVDEHDVPWDEAWKITQATCSYTNHTLLPEALEKWPAELLERVLPRHLQIIYEINRIFLKEVSAIWPEDSRRLQRMSLVEEGPHRLVRMANLAIVGSHAVNGVAALHSELIKKNLVPEFYEFTPQKFCNKTNGITPRRWLMHINPWLCHWISARIGDGWRTNLEELRKLEPYANDKTSQEEFREIKLKNKKYLAKIIQERTGVHVDPTWLFDIQAKRIHEYKRQLLNVLGIMSEYNRITQEDYKPKAPKLHLFAGKAAPGYFMAKLIIKLISDVANLVNREPKCKDYLKVVFLPDYKVSQAEIIIPGADLSEQISTAGMEASGTSNMKFALNGALTIGTWDGANIEIAEEVGLENIFIFGHRSEEVQTMQNQGYSPWKLYEEDPRIHQVIDLLEQEKLSPGNHSLFHPIREVLLDRGDHYLHLADFESYMSTHEEVSEVFLKPEEWCRRAILNVARMAKFSSDRTIREYARDIWNISSVPVEEPVMAKG